MPKTMLGKKTPRQQIKQKKRRLKMEEVQNPKHLPPRGAVRLNNSEK